MSRTTLASMNRSLARQVEGHMTDVCTIQSETEPAFDPADPFNTDPTVTVVYQGKCRVSPLAMAEDITESAGDQVVLKGYKVTVPRTVVGVEEGHVVVVTSANDLELVGRRLRVIDVPTPSHAPVRELRCRFQHGDET